MKVFVSIAVLFLLPLCPALAQSSKTPHSERLSYAVVPGVVSGCADFPEMGVGIAFDLERRLERWQCLEDADRIQLTRTADSVRVGGDKALVAAVLDKIKSDIVITFDGSCEGESIHLNVRLWKESASPAQSFEISGGLPDFFKLQDGLTDTVVAAIRAMYPNLPAPDKSARLKLAPALTLKAYALAIRGKLAMHKGEVSVARPLFITALDLEPKLWWAHYWLGSLAFQGGDFKAAIDHCKTALAIDPDLYPAIYANLSYCYAGLGDSANADKNQAEFERRAGKILPCRSLPPNR